MVFGLGSESGSRAGFQFDVYHMQLPPIWPLLSRGGMIVTCNTPSELNRLQYPVCSQSAGLESVRVLSDSKPNTNNHSKAVT